MSEQKLQRQSPGTAILDNYFLLDAPEGWVAETNFENMSLPLMQFGRVIFRPRGIDQVALKLELVDWLEGDSKWNIFQALLDTRGDVSPDDLDELQPILIRVPRDYIRFAHVSLHPGLESVLTIEYFIPEEDFGGSIIYAPAPIGESHVLMISFEGSNPHFTNYLKQAEASLGSCRRNPTSVAGSDLIS